ncbi:MAG: hypothetical protein M3P14_10315 [Chloroflexota bacterium]|nr:hypothetical protein [Chloroflexota bacterium]
MASKAEQVDLPAAPRLGSVLRQAGVDFYFQSIRLVLANAAWGICLIGVLVVAMVTAPPFGLLLAPLLAIPASGVFRLAALIAREEPPDFSDVTDAWRRLAPAALGAGVVLTLVSVVLAFDLLGAIGSANPVAWAFATMAGWGLIAVGTYTMVAWPLLVDPRRETRSMREKLRLAGLLLVAFPARMLGLALIAALILLASTVAFAALLSISLAYVALVACRYVLPAADRLEARRMGHQSVTGGR